MSVEKNVPEIRFKRFSGEWTRLTLGDLGTVAMNKRIFRHQTTTSGEVPFFKIGTFGKQPDAFISKTLFDEYKKKYPYPVTGDLLLSASGSIGRVVEYKGEEQYFQDSNIVWLKHDGRIDNLFLKVFYSMVKWSGLEGSTIKRLYNKNILDTEICTPERSEQIQIGNYFQKLDSLINQHKQKHDKLSNIKKAMLEKMFPKQGETTPEIRFKGFSGAWEEVCVGEIAKTSIGEFVKQTKQKPDSPYPVFNGGKSFTGHYDDYNNEGDKILVSARGANAGFVNYQKTRFWAGNSCYSIDVSSKEENHTIFVYFSIKRTQHLFTDFQQAANIPSVSKADVEKFKFMSPKFEEQTAIGNYFQKLDALINQHQQQITKLGNIKQACLSKMFV